MTGTTLLQSYRHLGNQAKTKQSIAFAESLRPIISNLQDNGVNTCQQIADHLNNRGLTTSWGSQWTRAAVARVLRRLAGD